MMNERMLELKNIHKKEEAAKVFSANLLELIKGCKYENPTFSFKECDSLTFYTHMLPFATLIKNKDDRIFLKRIPVLLDLSLPQIWIQETTDKAKELIIWDYIATLFANSKILHQKTVTEKVQDEEEREENHSSSTPSPESELTKALENQVKKANPKLYKAMNKKPPKGGCMPDMSILKAMSPEDISQLMGIALPLLSSPLGAQIFAAAAASQR